VQWTGPSPPQDPNNWDKITYKHDPGGRRIKKTVDGYKTTYCHDGGHEIAEYDGNGNILRKYVYGPGVDQPICMIEVADSNTVSYYHFDGLRSVVALSNSSGTTIQTYEYTVYGEVAAEDPNHPNPYLFTGRRFDRETGLYYYRARYYNPYIGRFLQTDPVGYSAGINLYSYCGNNPLGRVDPLGLTSISVPIPINAITSDAVDDASAEGVVNSWLADVGFYNEYPGWYIEYVGIDGDNFDVHLTDGCDVDVCDVKVPKFEIVDVGGAPVVVIDSIGRLDSRNRTLMMIMDAWFAACLAEGRWIWSPVDWYYVMMRHTKTPFREKPIIENWYYRGEIYDFTEVNYVGFGYAAAHFLTPLHFDRRFAAMVRQLPIFYNIYVNKNWASQDDLFWFNIGFDLYPGWKLDWLEISFLPEI